MINGKIIKVCGMREAENIQDVESIEGIDMLGFIFYPKSPRYVYELPATCPFMPGVSASLSMKISKWSACMLIVSD